MANGYNGKILRVNLSTRTISSDTLDELFCRRHLGGAGFSAYYLMKELKPGIDPLGPDNKLMLIGGPLCGLPFPGSAKISIGGKSPLTGGVAKSEVSGFFGAQLRHAGFDGIIVEGKADKPVYLWVHDGEAEIKDASSLWGKSTKETQDAIRAELGDNRIQLAMIGPAGENLVRFACVMSGLKDAAGRGGTGAIMGSKNLKAIAARGTKIPEIANPDGPGEFRQWVTDNRPLWASSAEFGTGAPAMMMAMAAIGNVPIRNFRDGDFPNMASITAGAVKDQVRIAMEGCYACVVRCKKVVKIDEPYQVDPAYGGPEYETLAALGSTCGVDNLKAICKGNELCGAYSLDTISTGVAIAFAMECYENGLLTNKDTGGIDLRFGNADAMLRAIELIAKRQGIGDLIAEGVKRAAEKIGKGAEKFAMHGKGLEVPMHDPRPKAVLGLGYEVNPHGADHCANVHDTAYNVPGPQLNALRPMGILEPLPADDLSPKKVHLFRYWHNFRILADSATYCYFVPYPIEMVVSMIKAVTGWDTGTVEMFKMCDRTLTLFRMFNLREGFSEADDRLPERYLQPHRGGPVADRRYDDRAEKREKARRYYYNIMGWDENGVPTPETLEALDVGWAGSK